MVSQLVNEYTEYFSKIASGGGKYYELKHQILLPRWYKIFESNYSRHNQYGLCENNKTVGVLTPRGLWSSINQFNTNSTVLSTLASYLNKRIYDDFLDRGITQIEFGEIQPIEFTQAQINNIPYVRSQLENYLWWIEFYADDIFINQRNIPKGHILNTLIDIAVETMSRGKYAEFLTEYHIRVNRPHIYVNRTTMVKGAHDDMSLGTDLITHFVNKDGVEVSHRYQIKVLNILNGDTIYKNIDINDYHNKGVHFFVAISLNRVGDFGTPRRITILHMNPKYYTFTKDRKNRDIIKFTNESILMNEELDYLSLDKVFYEFFLYCTKHDLNFVLEFNDDPSLLPEHWGTVNIEFNDETNIVNLTLPRQRKNYYREDVIRGWRGIAGSIESGDDLQSTLNRLDVLERGVF